MKITKIALLLALMIGTTLSQVSLQANAALLTQTQREYLSGLGEITMCVDPDWVPFEQITPLGEFVGIAADLVSLVAERLDITFTLLPTLHWDETVQKYENNECHIVPFLNQTPEREEHLLFTEPIFTDANVLITRNEYHYVTDLANISSATIALPSNTSVGQIIAQHYPNLTIIPTLTEKEAFQMVENNEADMTIRSRIIAAYTIRQEGLFNLRINGQLPAQFDNHFRIGVTIAEPKLRDILDIGVLSITNQDKEEIINRHVYIVIEQPLDLEMIGRIFFVVVLILGFILYWNRRLSKLSLDRERLLDNIPTQIWYFTNENTYGAVNQAYANFLGMKIQDIMFQTLEEVHSRNVANIFLEKNKIIFQEKEKLEYEVSLERADGHVRLLYVFQTPILNKKKEVDYIVCSAEDITEEKRQEEQVAFLTIHDQLTGLKNRRFFDDLMQKTNVEDVFPISFMMLDLNGLKLINDAFGHLEGDKAILQVASAIMAHKRAEDIAIRLSGDEFIVFFMKTDKKIAQNIGQHIQQTLEAQKETPFKISVSWGVGMTESKEDSILDIFKRAEDAMYKRKLLESSSMHNATIQVIMDALFDKSVIEQLHAESVKRISLLFGNILQLTSTQLKELELAAYMHDIGKTSLDVKLLHKEQPITENEIEILHKHPVIGYRILSSTNMHTNIARFILSHHEHFDGSGYPKGLQAEEIPLEARIIAIVEAYDMMSRTLPYRKALSKKEIINDLTKQKNKQFDGRLVDIFIEGIVKKELTH